MCKNDTVTFLLIYLLPLQRLRPWFLKWVSWVESGRSQPWEDVSAAAVSAPGAW